jgi:glutaredoxin
MADVLSSVGYEISNVLLGHVSWETMRDAIYDFFTDENIEPTDTLLFYYSGHGVPDNYQDVFLATSDIDLNVPSKRGFNFNELTKMVRDCISTSIVAILDCCYSGSARISKGREDDAARFGHSTIDRQSEKIAVQGQGKCILAASQAQGEAFDIEEHNHSLYTYYLLQALNGKVAEAIDNNGHVTVDSLSRSVYNTIMTLPPSKRPKQKPIMKLEASGDIILAYYPELAKIKTDYTVSQNITSVTEKTHLEKNIEDSAHNQRISTIDLEYELKKYIKEKKGRFSVPQCVRDFRERGINISNSEIGDIISRLYNKNK